MKTTLSNFRGLETARSIYEAAPNRAVSMSNFININGSNIKRKGLRPIADFNSEQIRGLWQFTEGGSKVLIVHAGTNIYRVVEGSNISSTVITKLTSLTSQSDISAVDSRSYGIEHNGVLHILCGDYLLYSKSGNAYALSRAVNNEEMTYIPTTTISIDSVGAAEQMRSNFEEVNLLTKWRINTLQGNEPTAVDSVDNKTFYLDNSIDTRSVITISIYKPGVAVTVYTCAADSNNIQSSKGVVDRDLGKICFNNAADVNIGRSDNAYIEVKYAHTTNIERREKILSSRIGTQFGLNGNNDRLFVANGNADHYSGANDYTYFPENNYTLFGSNTSSITGYSRINDGTLGVHKSYGDSSGIYYRNYSTISNTDINTGTSAVETIFPITAGAVGQWCVSGATCRSLDGDTLYLSDNGVYGITLGQSMVVNERYAKERSENISNLIASIVGKTNACAEVVDGRYHLYIDNQCFIADSRYKYSNEQSKDDTFSYEWWRHDYPCYITTTLLTADKKLYLGSNALYVEHTYRYDIVPCGTTAVFGFDANFGVVNTDKAAMEFLFGRNQVVGTEVDIMMYGSWVSTGGGGSGVDYRHRIMKARVKEPYINFYTKQGNATIRLHASDGKVAKVTPVSAEYVTPMLDLGDNGCYKTIHGVGAVVDNSELNDVTISCISKDSEDSVRILQGGHFDFNNINFNLISFGSPRFSTLSLNRFRRRKVNYIKFKFSSANSSQCVINNMIIEYDYTRKLTRGGNY